MNAEQYLRKWNVDVGVAPNKTIPEGDRRRTAKVLRGKKRKRIILLFIRSFEVFWQCAIYAQVGAKCRLFFFSLGISRYYYVCFEFGTAIRQRQLNLTVSDFRPFAVIIYRPATVANEKKIVYFMECVLFPLLLHSISSVSVHSGSPFEFNAVSVMILSAFDEPTADCRIHMLITTIWLFLNMKNWWSRTKLCVRRIYFWKMKMFYSTTS